MTAVGLHLVWSFKWKSGNFGPVHFFFDWYAEVTGLLTWMGGAKSRVCHMHKCSRFLSHAAATASWQGD